MKNEEKRKNCKLYGRDAVHTRPRAHRGDLGEQTRRQGDLHEIRARRRCGAEPQYFSKLQKIITNSN